MRSAKFTDKLPRLRQRNQIIRAIRSYFESQGFDEVLTPALQVSPGLEPHLVAFQTQLIDPTGKRPVNRYLHTSPEFAMKKLLVSGAEKIFQIAQVFRNQERSATHHPEFSMLEWYRTNSTYTDLMTDCERLLSASALAVGPAAEFTFRGVKAKANAGVERISVAEAFRKYAYIDILATIDDHKNPGAGRLRPLLIKQGIHTVNDDTWEDLFFRVFLEKIEPKLGCERPTILFDYPICMAALSRPKKDAPYLAERFEIYICGLELANAFGELTDPVEQKRRFESDMDKKQKLYGIRYPVDADFIAALEEGMPESSGIALGVDRLVMLLTGCDHIEGVLWSEVAAPEI